MYISRNRRRREQTAPSVQHIPTSSEPQQQSSREQNHQPPESLIPRTSPTERSSPIIPSIPPVMPREDARPQPSPSVSDSGTGYIIVRVTTASGAIPLEDALVSVRSYAEGGDADVIFSTRTNTSGLTERIALDAPSKTLSQSPGNSKGYKTYNIRVEKDGYGTQFYVNVPVFDGITAVQSADLVPLLENGQTDREDPYYPGIFYETENPELESPKNNSRKEN